MALSAEERETTVSYTDADDSVIIFSCIRKDITAMKKKPKFELIEEGILKPTTPWAKFRIARADFDISRAARSSRTLTDEQRQQVAERLAEARKKKEEAPNE